MGIKLTFYMAGVALVVGVVAVPKAGIASNVVVSPGSMGAWAFANSDGNGTVGNNPTGSGAMVVGPGTPPLGVGSANLSTGNGSSGGDGAEILSNSGYAGTELSALTALSYSTYDTQNNGSQFPYLSLEIALGANIGGTTYDQLFFEPPYQTPSTGNPSLPNQGATALNTWQSWNALTGGFWDNDGISGCGSPGTGVASLSSCISSIEGQGGNPTIVNTFGTPGVLEGVGGIQLAVGFASPSDVFNGNVDAVTIGVNGSNTTFDFEPLAATPLPATLPLFAGGLGAIGLFGWRKKRRVMALAT